MDRVCLNNLGWNTHYDRIRLCERLVDHGICTDVTAIRNSNLTKDDCSWAYIYIITDDWSLQASLVGTDVHIVHDAAVLAYLTGGIHYDATKMI